MEVRVESERFEVVGPVDELVDEMSLVGPVARIKERYRAWEDAGVTTMMVQSQQREALELMADITGASKGA